MAGIINRVTGGTPGLLPTKAANEAILGTGWDYGWKWDPAIARRGPNDIFSEWQFGAQNIGGVAPPVTPQPPIPPGSTETKTGAPAPGVQKTGEGGDGRRDDKSLIGERGFPYGWESDFSGPTGAPFVPGLDWDANLKDIANSTLYGLGFLKGGIGALPVLGDPFADPAVRSILDQYEKQFGLAPSYLMGQVREAYKSPNAPTGLLGLFSPPEYGYNTIRGLLMSYENGPFAAYQDAFASYEGIRNGVLMRGEDLVGADKLAGLFDAYAVGHGRYPSPYEVEDYARLVKLNPTWAANRLELISQGKAQDNPSPGSPEAARAAWGYAPSPTHPGLSVGDVIGGWLSGDPNVTTEQANRALDAYKAAKADPSSVPALNPMQPSGSPSKNVGSTSSGGSYTGQGYSSQASQAFGGAPSTGFSRAGDGPSYGYESQVSKSFGGGSSSGGGDSSSRDGGSSSSGGKSSSSDKDKDSGGWGGSGSGSYGDAAGGGWGW